MFMSEYPSDCDVNEIGEALLARFICHELLPDVDRVIAMDLADILVLDDIKDPARDRMNFMHTGVGLSKAVPGTMSLQRHTLLPCTM
eukprot:g6989.t1